MSSSVEQDRAIRRQSEREYTESFRMDKARTASAQQCSKPVDPNEQLCAAQLAIEQVRDARLARFEGRAQIAQRAMAGVVEMPYGRIDETVKNGTKIGEGMYGPVYECRLSDGRAVAVKMVGEEFLASARNSAEQEEAIERMFMAEINTLGHLRHPNVVRLLGYSRGTGGQRALVYELLAGGSLHDRIHDDNVGLLMAGQRISIALDIARGLAHLHGLPLDILGGGTGSGSSDDPQQTLHRDVKSANVALDGNTVAKLIDCGLSKGIDSNDNRSLFSITGGALGTPGYIAPEVTDGKYGVASDIYSFGVVLLELLTSRRAVGLVDSIRDAIEDDGRKAFLGCFADEWADNNCGWHAGITFDDLCNLALQCTERRCNKRPKNMANIVVRLHGMQQSWSAEHGGSSAAEVALSEVAAIVTPEDYRKLEAELKRACATIQELQTAPPALPAVEESTAMCCISFEAVLVSAGLLCESGHIVSDDFADQYVRSKNDGIVVDRPEVGRVVDLTALQRANRPDGAIYCPQRGENGCTAPAYSDQQIAQHVAGETFSQYVEVKIRVAERGVHDRAQTELQAEINRINRELGQQNVQVSEERLRQELRRQFPKAYQCGECGHGPIDHMACYDLTTHNGEGGINNACPVCGWFRPEIAQWPRWDGNLPAGVDATTGAAVRIQLPGLEGAGSSTSTESDYDMAQRLGQEWHGKDAHPVTQNLMQEQRQQQRQERQRQVEQQRQEQQQQQERQRHQELLTFQRQQEKQHQERQRQEAEERRRQQQDQERHERERQQTRQRQEQQRQQQQDQERQERERQQARQRQEQQRQQGPKCPKCGSRNIRMRYPGQFILVKGKICNTCNHVFS